MDGDSGATTIQELLKTQTALRNLIKRNRDLPVEVLAARNKEARKGPTALQLPFILIQVVHCHCLVHLQQLCRQPSLWTLKPPCYMVLPLMADLLAGALGAPMCAT